MLISPRLLLTESTGTEKPVADCWTLTDKHQNRRDAETLHTPEVVAMLAGR